MAMEAALSLGLRGFSRGGTLARLLAEHRGKRNPKALPAFSVEQILGWADAYFRRCNEWPPSQIPDAIGCVGIKQPC